MLAYQYHCKLLQSLSKFEACGTICNRTCYMPHPLYLQFFIIVLFNLCPYFKHPQHSPFIVYFSLNLFFKLILVRDGILCMFQNTILTSQISLQYYNSNIYCPIFFDMTFFNNMFGYFQCLLHIFRTLIKNTNIIIYKK